MIYRFMIVAIYYTITDGRWHTMILTHYNVFNQNTISILISKIKNQKNKYSRRDKHWYYQTIITFDIETSSFYDDNGEKCALPYVWQMCVDGDNYICRDFSLFYDFLTALNNAIKKNERVIIYVHNLAYEFQFIRKYVCWTKIFAINARTPLYAQTDKIIFKCSLLYSGKSLEKIGEDIGVEKLKSKYDYDKIRTPITPLTNIEIEYCIRDVYILYLYIKSEMDIYGDIQQLELTKTGKVRTLFRNATVKSSANYRKIIGKLTLQPTDYVSAKRAFMGGFTHSNAAHTGKLLHNVHSFDIASAYPCMMVTKKFPYDVYKRFTNISYMEYMQYATDYCIIADFTFSHLKSIAVDDYLSKSKFTNIENYVENNGRITYAENAVITLTEIDFDTVSQTYDFDLTTLQISNVIIFKKQYLPREFIKTTLELYGKKTMLKNVSGSEIEYMLSKENINSAYGMMVTDIARELIEYDTTENEWSETQKLSLDQLIKQVNVYNSSKQRFLYYPWGVYVTAYCRQRIWRVIRNIGMRYIYSDTDSVKCFYDDTVQTTIDSVNTDTLQDIANVSSLYGIDKQLFMPSDTQGITHTIGLFECDGVYKKFKTLGAKRYIYIDDNDKLHITIAGLNKSTACEYIDNNGKFNFFTDHMRVPSTHSGRMTHTYIDVTRVGTITDYLGNTYDYKILSCIHLEKSEFTLNMTDLYKHYIDGERIIITK